MNHIDNQIAYLQARIKFDTWWIQCPRRSPETIEFLKQEIIHDEELIKYYQKIVFEFGELTKGLFDGTTKTVELTQSEFEADLIKCRNTDPSANPPINTTGEKTFEVKPDGSKSSFTYPVHLIPHCALQSLAMRFQKGIETYGDCYEYRKSLNDSDYIRHRIAHGINHLYHAIDVINGIVPDNGDDDAGAVLWVGTLLAEYYKHKQRVEDDKTNEENHG